MNFSGYDLEFWLAALGAALLKVITSPKHSITRSATTIAAAVFCAWAFTDAVLVYLELDPESYTIATAALIALTGENVTRWVMDLSPEKIIALWKGRGK